MRLPEPPLLLITDRRQAKMPLPELVGAALEAGCRWVSLREKDMAPAERRALLRQLVKLGGRFGATVGVHEDAEAAAAAGAGALHLPAGGALAAARHRLASRTLLGISTHGADEGVRAGREGADYVTYSPVFESLSKPGYGSGARLDGLAEVVSRAGLPVIALGGVRATNAADCLRAGAAGVAVMGAVMAADHPGEKVAELLDAFG